MSHDLRTTLICNISANNYDILKIPSVPVSRYFRVRLFTKILKIGLKLRSGEGVEFSVVFRDEVQVNDRALVSCVEQDGKCASDF